MSAFSKLRADSTAGGRKPTNPGGNGLQLRKSLSETVNGNYSVAKLLKKDLKDEQWFLFPPSFLHCLLRVAEQETSLGKDVIWDHPEREASSFFTKCIL